MEFSLNNYYNFFDKMYLNFTKGENMGIFDSILDKLGFGEDEKKEETTQNEEVTEPQAVMSEETEPQVEETSESEPVEAVAVVDVVARLELQAEKNPGLDWKNSIVDLLELLQIDSSYENRKELAKEMGIEDYHGTAEQNIALHKAVLQKIAANGGNIPQELLA